MTVELRKKVIVFLREWVPSLVIAVLLTTSLRSAIADWNDVPTGSMNPTILEGDRIFVNKLAYDLKVPFTTWHLASWQNPVRGDIVVFFSPADERRLVKRVVGLPGDTLSMQDNKVILNGKELDYRSLERSADDLNRALQSLPLNFYTENLAGINHTIMTIPAFTSRNTFHSLVVPEDHYFVMGDNRDNSADSRYIGFVERRRIIGRVSAVVISVNPDHYYLPRWERFFLPLM